MDRREWGISGASSALQRTQSSERSSTSCRFMRSEHRGNSRRHAHAWGGLLTGLLLAFGGQSADAADMSSLRAAALQHVNVSRKHEGLPPLKPSGSLNQAAQRHADDMLERDYYAHVTPGGDGPRDRFLDAGGGKWELVAENIARCRDCGALDPARVSNFHDGWMNSPEHRENILRRGLTRFGFGAAAGDGVIYAVQTFAGPGTPRGEDRKEVDSEGVGRLALEVLNAARGDAGVPDLALSPALNEATEAALPGDLGSFRIEDLDPFAAMPGSHEEFSRLQALVGECGGCGAVATAGDVRAFVGDWLDQDDRRARLLAPDATHVAMAMRSDGQGRKVALLVLGAER